MFRHALNENVTEIIVAVYSLKMTENSGIINNTYYFLLSMLFMYARGMIWLTVVICDL